MLTYCELTNETITTAYAESVQQVFAVVSFEVIRKRQEKELLEKFKRAN